MLWWKLKKRMLQSSRFCKGIVKPESFWWKSKLMKLTMKGQDDHKVLLAVKHLERDWHNLLVPNLLSPTTSEPSAAAAANLHFRPAPNPLPPHLGGGSAPSAPRKRPLSAFPSRVTVSPVGRRPASACGVRERFVHNSQVPDLDMNRMYFRDSETPAVLLLIFVCPCWSNWKWEASKKKERLRRKQKKLGFEIRRASLLRFVFWLNMERYVWYGYMMLGKRQKKSTWKITALPETLLQAYRSRSWSWELVGRCGFVSLVMNLSRCRMQHSV